MRSHVKASSAGSTEGNGNSRGLFRRAFAARGLFRDSEGGGARSPLRTPLAVLAIVVAALALAAAPAWAGPKTTAPVVSNVSYASAHVNAEVQGNGFATYSFEVSTDGVTWTPNAGGFVSSPVKKPVAADLTGLRGGTTYAVRLKADNFDGFPGFSPQPNPEFTTLPVASPTVVSIDNASEVAYTTAKASGKVKRPEGNADPAFDVDCRFQYVTDAQFNATGFGKDLGEAACEPENPVHASGEPGVEANLTGLLPGTTYHLRLLGTNAGGSDSKVAASTFTTSTPAPPAVVTVDDASEVTYTTAKATGRVLRPAGSDHAIDTSCNFEYVTNAQFNADGFTGATQLGCLPESILTNEGEQDVEANLTGLANNTTYHLRLTAANPGGSDSKVAASTFTTAAVTPPSVLSIDSASEIAYTSVKASGEIERPADADPAFDVDCRFEYISNAAFPNIVEKQKLVVVAGGGTYVLGFNGATTAPIPFNANAATVQAALQGLPEIGPGAVTATGGPGGFTITFTGPLANKNVPQIGLDGGGLSGEGISYEISTTTEGHAEGFEDAARVGCEPESTVTAPGKSKVEANLTGLANNTTYHLRLTAANAGGSDSKVASSFTTLTVAPPLVVADDAAAVTAASAHFSGHITAGNDDPAFESSCEFRYVSQGQFDVDGFASAKAIGCAPPSVTGTTATEVTADPTDLEPNTTYHLRLQAGNQGGVSSDDATSTFLTETTAPVVSGSGIADITATTATLRARVRPGGTATTYHFEYLTLAQYEAAGEHFTGAASTPESASIGADNEAHLVTAAVGGLAADTPYRFRVVATNAKSGPGGVIGSAGAFHTQAAGSDPCPNASVRAQQESRFLPDCRAYEMVTPFNKHGYRPVPGLYGASAPDGSAVVYATSGPIGAADRGLQSTTTSRRVAGGWATAAAVPAQDARNVNVIDYGTFVPLFSPDLRAAAFTAACCFAPDFPEEAHVGNRPPSVFLANPDKSVDWLGRPQIPKTLPDTGEALAQLSWTQVIGGRPDLGIVYFWQLQTIVPSDAARTEGENVRGYGLYEYSGGETRSAGTLPDGSESPYGAAPANSNYNHGFGFPGASGDLLNSQISGDGSTLFFIGSDGGPEPPQLYVRRDGHSKLVSHAQDGTAAPSGVAAVEFPFTARFGIFPPLQHVYGSKDGKTAIFQSVDALAPGAPSDSSQKAYRYDVETDAVTYLPGVGTGSIVAASNDLRRFLFMDGAVAGQGGSGIKVWNEGTIETIFAGIPWSLSPARATPSGSAFVFSSRASIPGFNHGNNVSQVYRYDIAQHKLACVSCPPDDVEAPQGGTTVVEAEEGLQARGMSEDGERVFFTTADPLVPRDVNGVEDVYEWTPTRTSLISSGQGPAAFLVDNSASGDDVFFVTEQGLDPFDNDKTPDIFDAHVNGGVLREVATPCAGEGCRDSASAKPAGATSATSAFVGAGNGAGNDKPGAGPRVKVGARRLAGDSLKLTVTVPGPGRVAVSGAALQGTRKTYRKAGTYQLEAPLNATARSSLRGGGPLKLKVRLRFSPRAGKPSSVNFVLTVKA